jgi:hypothetical protein
MKYAIMGFNQTVMMHHDLNLTLSDLLILRWFVDFEKSGKMIKYIHENEAFFNIRIDGVLRDIPMYFESKSGVHKILKKLISLKILKRITVKNGTGTYGYYNYDEMYYELIKKQHELCEKYEKDQLDEGIYVERGGCVLQDTRYVPADTRYVPQESPNNQSINNTSTITGFNKLNPRHLEKPNANSDDMDIISTEENNDSSGNKINNDLSTLDQDSILESEVIGLDSESLEIIHDIYDLFEIKKTRLPKDPSSTNLTKTVKTLVHIINSIRSGSFLQEFPLSKDWMDSNGIDPQELSTPFTSFSKARRFILETTKAYTESIKSNRMKPLQFFWSDRGPGGDQVPAHSMFAKYTAKDSSSEVEAKISKIKERMEKSLAEMGEKVHNAFEKEFNIQIKPHERIRFWQGWQKLIKFYEKHEELLTLANTSKSRFKSMFSGTERFLRSLMEWILGESGLPFYPGILETHGIPWQKFVDQMKRDHGFNFAVVNLSDTEKGEALFSLRSKKRESTRSQRLDRMIRELSEKYEEEGLGYMEAEAKAQKEAESRLLGEDMEWSEKQERLLCKGRLI